MKTPLLNPASLRVISNRSIFTILACCCLFTNLSGEISKSSLIEVKTIDGKKFDAAFQEFKPADESMLFIAVAGGEKVIACSKLTPETLGRAAMKMTVVADLLPENSADLCNRVTNAKSSAEEELALAAIYSAGSGSSCIKENLALFQLYGVVFQLLSTERAAYEAQKSLEIAEKEANQFKARELKWLERNRINPLTGRDRTKEHMAYIERGLAKIVSEPLRNMQQSKSRFMMRLASVQAYAIHCDNLKKPEISGAVADLRTKVLKRSIVGQEMEKAAGAILGWLISRTVVHHYTGDEKTFYVGAFGKLFFDTQVDQAFDILFFDLPEDQRGLVTGAIKGALISLTEGRVTRQEIAIGTTREALLNLLATQSPELKTATDAVDRVMPFLEEALRMASK